MFPNQFQWHALISSVYWSYLLVFLFVLIPNSILIVPYVRLNMHIFAACTLASYYFFIPNIQLNTIE